MEKLSSQEVKELSREPFHWICNPMCMLFGIFNPVPINVDCKSTKNNQRIVNLLEQRQRQKKLTQDSRLRLTVEIYKH